MKVYILLLVCAPIWINAQNEKGIHFNQHLTWEQLKDKAKIEHKYIFMDVVASWCGPCKKMDKEVYSSDSVANYMNEKFISIKVQMDTSIFDNQEVQKWYADARKVYDQYKIDAFPTFLFFAPNGRLVYRSIGFRNASDFIALSSAALYPKNSLYYIKLENYKIGNRDYKEMRELAQYAADLGDKTLAKQIAADYISNEDKKKLLTKEDIYFVFDVARNKRLSDSLAKVYLTNYLFTLSESELCTEENLRFVGVRFWDLINSGDKVFRLFYYRADKVDSIMKEKGWARIHVEYTVTREELENTLLVDGKPQFKNPKWRMILLSLQKKYESLDAEKLVLNYKVRYYKSLKNWPEYIAKLTERVEKYGPLGTGILDLDFNNNAWDVFLYSSTEKYLKKALSWSDSAITINPTANWMDTKANLLYKLGKVEEAIELENKAIVIEPKNTNFSSALEKMKEGLPTWPKM